MYWSVYDTFVLLSGIITAVIAVIPIDTIPAKTRGVAAAVGGGLILLSVILGNIASFTYPGIVFVAPLIALAVGGVIVKTALDARRQRDAGSSDQVHPNQYGETAHGVTQAILTSAAAAPQLAPAPIPPPATADARATAWADLFDPATTAERLAEIAGIHPDFAPQIAVHPHAYPGLKAWAATVTPRGAE